MEALGTFDLLIRVVYLVLLIALPLISKKVEHNLEVFFFIMAVSAATIAGIWSDYLLKEAFLHPVAVYQPGIGYIPIGITQVVLIAGVVFYLLRHRLSAKADLLARPGIVALLIFALGLSSSVISAIVAAAVLAELLAFARASHEYKARAAVYAAFAIGAGAALLPIGEPLSTIAVAKLKEGFFYLVDLIFDAVFIIVAFFAIYTYFVLKKLHTAGVEVEPYEPQLRVVLLRAGRIFLFIFALTILGEFFKPVAEIVAGWGKEVLYVFGLLSAVADNATLVAALVVPEMARDTLRSFLISLVVAGGLTIPGNVPNIIFANVLKIGFKEWIRLALKIGMAVFLAIGVYVLFLVPYSPFRQ
ncbi:MAG: DUF1646 family protein [Pyrobaculum sp.]